MLPCFAKGERIMRNEQPTTERGRLLQKYHSARSNLLLVIILTLVNIVLFLGGSESMLLFSASIPYYAVIFGVALDIVPLGIGFAAVILVLYFLSWLLSKKKSGWLVVALILFILDTLGMLLLYFWAEDISGILDAAIHIWVLYYLFVGVSTGKKLKTMPEEDILDDESGELAEAAENDHSSPIRRVEEGVKFRVLLESEYAGRKVIYRRVKRTNQLVINDYIYDEIEMLVETGHYLYATIDGHRLEVGFDGAARSYFKVDGELVAKKIRWY